MSVYRPAGFGQPPTREEHDEARKRDNGESVWLVNDHRTLPGVYMVWVEDGELVTSLDECVTALSRRWRTVAEVAVRHPDLKWCLLGPDTCYPCPIGEPTATEAPPGEAALVSSLHALLTASEALDKEALALAAMFASDADDRSPADQQADYVWYAHCGLTPARERATKQVAQWREAQGLASGAADRTELEVAP